MLIHWKTGPSSVPMRFRLLRGQYRGKAGEAERTLRFETETLPYVEDNAIEVWCNSA